MKTVFVDFETFYSTADGYTLRKMTPVEYILDPRFETIGCAISVNGLSGFMTPAQLRDFLTKLPSKVMMVSHNALFDMCVMAFRFGYVPSLMVDTLGMSRAWNGHRFRRHGIGDIAPHLGMKKGTAVYKMDGLRLADIIAGGYWNEYAAYSIDDNLICEAYFRQMISEGFPISELAIMDLVLRCAVQPKFRLDQHTLALHLNDVQRSKEELLARCGMTSKDDLMSNDRFAAVLRSLGVDPPLKTSLATGKTTYAFAKTDHDFIALEEHEDEEVQALVSARMGVKSTLEETRTQRFLAISRLTWPGNEQQIMPIPLRYGAAHTHRLGGDWKLNLQNMPRGSKAKPPRLRESLMSREGTLCVKADASQIEARFVADFCDQTDLRQAFEDGRDVYCEQGSDIYGRTITKADVPERFVSKTVVLGCGFGVGGKKVASEIRIKSKQLLGTMIEMDEAEGNRVVGKYREKNYKVPRMWQRLNDVIPQMTRKDCSVNIGPVVFEFERVRLPNGLFINYHKLEWKVRTDAGGKSEKAWWFEHGGVPKKIYGGKFLENIIQALARLATMEAAVRIKDRLHHLACDLGIDPVLLALGLQEHDALAYCPPDGFEDAVGEILVEEMVRRPTWAPTVPLACQDGYAVGISYGHAK